ncbi:MAG TPA: TetR/AcrR family transcriptional regulator C-terminal domain-containing protein [Propionicimonas sp.]|jgi:AcrR family transcriptional regulator
MPARTSKEPLSRERVLDAALVVADRDGLAALTMRRVADELDCEAMSLYYYVKDKAGLLSGLTAAIIDEVIAETLADATAGPGSPDPGRSVGTPTTPASAADWRSTVRDRCLGARRVMLRHPWAPPLVATEPNIPARTMVIFEGLVSTMVKAGFDFEIAHRAIHSLGSMIMGFTQEIFEPGSPSEAMTTEEIAELATAFPYLGAMAMTQPHDQTDSLSVCDTQAEFEFTLTLILNGLESFRG